MLKNHPKGLMTLFFTEMWERFGFYIMMAVFVLYMDKQFGWSDSQKGDFYGIFLGAVYFIPILGGYIGDRLLNRVLTIKLGAVIMFFGYISLAFSALDKLYLFYLGLVLVSFGTGIFKANVSVIVGSLYHKNPELKDAGYNIFYMGINIGAALAPLAATLLSSQFDSYNLSFAAAAVGMVISFIILQRGTHIFKEFEQSVPVEYVVETQKSSSKDTSEDGQRILSLIILFIIVIFFWIGFYQNGFALTLFAERSTIVLDYLRPETYQFFNPFFILVLTPVLLAFFARLNRQGKEPSTPLKIFIGMIVMGLSMFIMVIASSMGGNADQNIMSPMWLISTYLVVTLAEILISPMGLSFVSKVAPNRFQGIMMGGWFGATALGSYGSGLLGKYYSTFAHNEYFMILAGLLFFSAILVLLFLKKLKRFA
jgi:POT family proton-dependent oligopeptide transporter